MGYSRRASRDRGPQLIDVALCDEAIRLGRLLERCCRIMGSDGLLALMLLHDARRASRISVSGDVVLLENQDRSQWDRDEIAEGLTLVDNPCRFADR